MLCSQLHISVKLAIINYQNAIAAAAKHRHVLKGDGAVGRACSDRKTDGQLLKARVAPGVELVEDPKGLFELQISKPV